MAATQANASKPEIHTAPFTWRRPEISELEAVNLPDGSVLGIAVPAAAAQRRDRSPAIAHFDNRYLGKK